VPRQPIWIMPGFYLKMLRGRQMSNYTRSLLSWNPGHRNAKSQVLPSPSKTVEGLLFEFLLSTVTAGSP
jgi:hypothetical protein